VLNRSIPIATRFVELGIACLWVTQEVPQPLSDASGGFSPPLKLARLDQPYPRNFQPFSPFGDIDDNAIPFTEAREPGSFTTAAPVGATDHHWLEPALCRDREIAETV